MNTIPSIFNERQIKHIILEGKSGIVENSLGITCIMINRLAGIYRSRALENILACNFSKVICVEKSIQSFSPDQLSKQFPKVKFIVAQEEVTTGDLLNIAFSQCHTKYAFVINDDLCLDKLNFTPSIVEKLVERVSQDNTFCITPKLFNRSMQEPLPVVFIPTVAKSSFCVESVTAFSEGDSTLYAADWCGFYRTEDFLESGGVDYTIKSEYWQKLDFFFRAWLWGKKVTVTSLMQFTYGTGNPEEDRTIDFDYMRFYLKNLLPVYKSDHGEIQKSSFFAFKIRSSYGFTESMKQFKEARRWVEVNKYRFKNDAVHLIQDWS